MLSKVSQTPSQARSYLGCTPPAKNDAATAVTAPAASGLGACIQVSNLDKSRYRVVKRGLTVSINSGFHYRVIRVRAGLAWCSPISAFGTVNDRVVYRLPCSHVRVVA